MEKQDESFIVFKKISLKLSFVMIFSTLLSIGVFQAIQYVGWPDTVKWFFSAFIWIFALLTGSFHVIEKIRIDRTMR